MSVDGILVATNLEHTARCAVALARGEPPPPPPSELAPEAAELAQRVTTNLVPRQRFITGLFVGGTLAEETAAAIRRTLGDTDQADEPRAGELLRLRGHRMLDLGDDAYTRGRPHPVIDPRLRNEQLIEQAASGEVALFVLDVILGYGAHPDPAGALARALERAREEAAKAGARLNVLASITGTDEDPQDYQAQRRTLEEHGVLVAETSSTAALVAARVAGVLEGCQS